MNLEAKIEAILLAKNEPIGRHELARLLDTDRQALDEALSKLRGQYAGRGFALLDDGESVSLGTAPEASALIEKLRREEFAGELGRAGLETLAIVLYKGPVSRREIDHIRGVNSSYILRNLLIRGLIARTESSEGERSYSYKPTIDLLRYLGLARKEDLPDYEDALRKVDRFVEDNPENAD